MSADSPRRAVHKGAQIVSPQPIVDRTIAESVAGIINDIVPQVFKLLAQAYTSTPTSDNKESISWARFEFADVNDPALYPDYNEGSSTPPLLLVLGYATGVQVWLIAATGEASEVLSWRQGVVRTLRILPNPKTDDEHVDPFEAKRPMVAICDSAGPGPQFCNVSFISLKTGEQTKSIKFKNPICDILANRRSVVVAFLEKIAVFDARTLNDVLSITTCYASPGPNPNPIALGTRWLAYSEKKLLPGKRSSGGCEGEGVQSYTATVLYAAKSLGKGLRGLGETVASSLTGNSVSPMAVNNTGNDITQPGVVTILDLKAAKEERETDDANIETIIAHFTAHSDAIVAMTFDSTGALLMTADKRGHDFHVFRIQPHPGGPTLAAVHHLYVLHRGDTTAKVQDMAFSSDTRWAAVSTVRGTTHVFPVAPYGGPIGVRTHSTPHVVNRLSRFHRSAGLTDDGTRSHSPVSHSELPLSIYPYSNPRLPPYPHPTILLPLRQIRQPSSLGHTNSQPQPSRPQQRQRLHSDDSGTLPLKICACFAPPRAWIYAQREASSKVTKRAVDSLFIMACHGNLIQYDLEPRPASGIPKEKICDDTAIELDAEAKGQWPLLRSPSSVEIAPPLPLSSPLLSAAISPKNVSPLDSSEDRWLSQVEIVTHAGPHRRLWMGPQFVFKTYNAPSGVAVNLVEAEAVEVGITGGSRPARSNPVNMPHATSRPLVPVVIDGSGSSYEQSPRFMEAYGDPLDGENMRVGSGENQLREDLAEAMLETSITPNRAPGRRSVIERVGQPVAKVVNPLGTVITVSADEEDASSSQEFDSAEENLAPDPPRSVCAEEGPASLGDLEPESQTLRDLTEICAEMRSASEPAIDRVPDEQIKEVKERKELCVEFATAVRNSTIDFEREEAFRDVPTSLSLCAEQGEIPSSPMTHAKEQAWSRRSKREDLEMHERSLAKAKYVVNYDEDCVVLMEDKTGCARRGRSKIDQQISKNEHERMKKGKAHQEASKKTTIECRRVDKYILKEQDDSIIIEDTTERSRPQKSEQIKKKSTCDVQEVDKKSLKTSDEVNQTESNRKQNVKDNKKKEEKKSKELDDIKDSKSVDSFVELENELETQSLGAGVQNEVKDLPEPSFEPPPPLEDFGSIDYHIVEGCKETFSNQSDEDIEHIQNNEMLQTDDHLRSKDPPSCSESSPVPQRKSSKSTISDDDLEYIHSCELSEVLEKTSGKLVEKMDDNSERKNTCSKSNKKQTKQAWSSDDDLEHVQYSDICESELGATCSDVLEKATSLKKSQKVLTEQTSKSKSKKRKDIVVIDPIEVWDAPKKDLSSLEEMEKCVDSKSSQELQSRLKKTKSLQTTSSILSKRPQRTPMVIIDIDAIRKAEMECKVLSPRHEPPNIRWQKRMSRWNKKTQSETQEISAPCESSSCQSSKVKVAELQEAAEELLVDSKWQESQSQTAPSAEVSWSTIVKKKNVSIENEPRKELDLEPLLEVEEKLDRDETKSFDPVEVIEESRCNELVSILEEESDVQRSSKSDEDIVEDTPCDVPISEDDPVARTSDEGRTDDDEGRLSSKIQGTTSRQVVEDTVSDVERVDTTKWCTSSKENSPDREKKSDSDQDVVPERSSSSDELNTMMMNAMPVDLEEDQPPLSLVERSTPTNGGGAVYTKIISTVKRNARSKKKKRR